MAGTITAAPLAPGRRGVVKLKATLLCDAAGTVTTGVMGTAYGRLVGVNYKRNTLDVSADITVTDDAGATIISTTTGFGGINTLSFRPTQVIVTSTGGAITNDATAPNVNRDIFVAGKIKVGVLNGGNLGTGELHLIFDERPSPAHIGA